LGSLEEQRTARRLRGQTGPRSEDSRPLSVAETPPKTPVSESQVFDAAETHVAAQQGRLCPNEKPAEHSSYQRPREPRPTATQSGKPGSAPQPQQFARLKKTDPAASASNTRACVARPSAASSSEAFLQALAYSTAQTSMPRCPWRTKDDNTCRICAEPQATRVGFLRRRHTTTPVANW
jgi:hypothetical protein